MHRWLPVLLLLSACAADPVDPGTAGADDDEDTDAPCPCAPGSYCNQVTHRCRLGCRADQDCAAGDPCDLVTETCVPTCPGTACPADGDDDADDPCAACTLDDNPCTADTCDAGGACLAPPFPDGTVCPDDGNPCTADACAGALCVHAETTADCADDGNPCTHDVCAAGTCTHPATTGEACPDDGNLCTADLCAAGTCGHPVAADGTPCGDVQRACLGGTCTATDYACAYDGSQWVLYPAGTGWYACTCDHPFGLHVDGPPDTCCGAGYACTSGCFTTPGYVACF